jgi:hypothetical protein
MYTPKMIVDATRETLSASAFAIDVAKRLDGKLVAIAFVNAGQILKMTGYEGTGLCGSGVFINAYEKIIQTMVDVNESLIESLSARAGGHSIVVKQKILIGEPATQIGETACADDFYILGGTDENMVLAKTIFAKTRCPVGVFTISAEGTPHLRLLSDNSPAVDDLIEMLRTLPIEVSRFGGKQLETQVQKVVAQR